MAWIQSLRNETKSEPLRLALDDVTCVITRGNTNPVEDTKTVLEDEVNELQKGNNAEEDSEATTETVIDQVAIVDMPAEALPCPSELKGEDSLMLSSKDDSYWSPSSGPRLLSNLFFISTLLSVLLH